MKVLVVGPYPPDVEELLRKRTYILESNSKNAVNIIKKYPFDVIVTGLHIGNPNGFGILADIQKFNPGVIPIVTSGDKRSESIEKCYELGARSYIYEPFGIKKLEHTISRLINGKKNPQLIKPHKNEFLPDEIDKILVGESTIIRQLKNEILQIAPTKSNVLLTGESGTGKDITARLIHMYSSQENTFISLNCGSLPESLVESELFGYEKGSFTGAFNQKKGIFEQADRGTLFLDEIGELSLTAQVKLLKVIEDRVIRRIGGNRDIPLNIRLIAATNKNLENEVRNKKFREDLYYRLNIVTLFLPPLRMRTTDISIIAGHLLKKLNTDLNKNIKGFAHKAIDKFMEYPWPGNVRELRNIIERAVIFCKNDYIDEFDIDLGFSSEMVLKSLPSYRINDIPDISDIGLNTVLINFEKKIISETLKKLNYNKTKTAEFLKIKRTTLIEKIKRLELKV